MVHVAVVLWSSFLTALLGSEFLDRASVPYVVGRGLVIEPLDRALVVGVPGPRFCGSNPLSALLWSEFLDRALWSDVNSVLQQL